jgi:hypothetical protein
MAETISILIKTSIKAGIIGNILTYLNQLYSTSAKLPGLAMLLGGENAIISVLYIYLVLRSI